jgi:hypothetical protein
MNGKRQARLWACIRIRVSKGQSMSQSVILNPLQWGSLKDIDDARPIDDSDAACLEEVRLVLAKHGNLDRFGIALLHSHFHVAEDEMMLETTDVEHREQRVRPVKKSGPEQVGLEPQATIVRFDDRDAIPYRVCIIVDDGSQAGF